MPSFPRQPPVQIGDEVAGKYRVDRVLGAGAMGVVVRAWHIELEQEVAIKFLHPELATRTNGAERFRREARSAVRILSDHVARVLDVGTLEGSNVPFIVMEYLRGRDLARVLAERGSLLVGEAARYVLEACDAIGEAHARGIVHRDLKPANLFLVDRPSGGHMIKVLDFGISKTLGDGPKGLSITEPATLMGSPGYMSPEQLESSRNVDARTDIWSLGVILYELVTGALPFDGDTVPQLIRSVISGQRTSLSEYPAAIAALEPVVSRCLHQDRSQRFQSIAELCEALSPFAQDGVAAARAAESLRADTTAASGTRASQPPGSSLPDEKRPPSVPDSAWGRTHGVGRSPLWRTVALAALLGAAAAAGFWRGRDALRSFREPSQEAGEAEVSAVALQPLPAPSLPAPAVESGAAGNAAGANGSSAAAPQVTPVAPPTTPAAGPAPASGPGGPSGTSSPGAQSPSAQRPPVQPPAPPPAAAPRPAPAASADDAFDLGAALGSASKASAGTAAAPVQGPTGAPGEKPPEGRPPVHAEPERNPYEIPEFGGRK